MKRLVWHNIWEVAFNRFRYFYDPTYRVNGWAFLKHIMEFGFDFVDDPKFLPSRLEKLPQHYADKRLFILGHTHLLHQLETGDKRFLVTDTWRDEYNILTQGLPKKKKTYAEIVYDNGVVEKAVVKIFAPALVGVPLVPAKG